MNEITRTLGAIGQGDRQAARDLLPLVYEELHKIAVAYFAREEPGQTLQATALVHEAYLRLVSPLDPGWDSRRHFYKAAAIAMERILVDHARRKKTLKRGGHRQRVDLASAEPTIEGPSLDILALNEALTKLEAEYPARADVVRMRYFTGLNLPEVAELLGIGLSTAEAHWRFARAWLLAELGDDTIAEEDA